MMPDSRMASKTEKTNLHIKAKQPFENINKCDNF